MPASTVESAFVLIDRASPNIRKIRRELRGMQRDAEAAGLSLDHLSGPEKVTRLERLARGSEDLHMSHQRLATGLRTEERLLARVSSQHVRTERSTVSLTRAVKGLGGAISLLKWPTMIAGAGGATQAITGLAAGAVALVPKLGDVAGAGAAAGTMFVGLGTAMGVTKLATQDLTDAYGGNEKALKRLTPEGRAFLQLLKDMQPEVRALRREAQRGLFPGLGNLLQDVQRQRGAIRQIVRTSSGDLGGLATFAGNQISRPGFMRDTVTLADQGDRALGAAARSAFYFASGIEQILIAGGPLTDWLGNTVEKWSQTFEETMKVKRATGELDDYFDRTKDTLEDLWRIGDHALGGLGGLLRAASGEGDDMWESIDKVATRWDEWANSFEGQNDMRRWFADVRPVLDATVNLIGDLGEEVGKLASGQGGTAMIDALDRALPTIAGGVGDLTNNFGPAAIDALAHGVELIGDLGAASGPLTTVAHAVGLVAETVDDLVKAMGPLGPVVGQLGVSALILSRMGLLGGGRQASAASVMSLGMMRAPAAGGGIGATGAAIVGGGAAVSAGRLARLRGGAGVFGGTTRDLYAVQRSLGAGRLASLGGALGGAGELTGLGSAAATGTAAAGRVLWPLLLASGAMGALGTEGGAGAKLQGGASAVSMGIVPRPISDSERATKGGEFAAGVIDDLSTNGSLGAQRRTIASLRGTIQRLPGNDAFNQNEADLGKATKLLQRELKQRERLLHESEQAHLDSLRTLSVQHAQAMAEDFAHAFEIRAQGPGGPVAAMDRTVDAVLRRQARLRPAGAKVLDETMLAWAQQQAQENPKLAGEYEDLVKGIEKKFSRLGRHVEVVNGEILTGSRSEWRNIRVALTSQTEQAREEASADFTAIQQQAVGALTAMGFSPSEARDLIRDMESGGLAGRVARNDAAAGPTAGTRRSTVTGRHNRAQQRRMARTGDGAGPELGRGAQVARASGGNLMGADPALAPYAAVGAQFGNRVTSGLRPGAITSSGNPSYHGSGHAIDIAGGDMMAAAKAIASQYGPGLEELIYSPLGWGIKNGKRVPLWTFGPEVIADHYDHVHVADVDPRLDGGGLGAMVSMDTAGPGLMRVNLKGRQSKLGGLPGLMATAAGGLYAAGLEKKLNEALMGGMAGPGGGLTSAGGTLDKAGLAALWAQANPGLGDPNLMAAIALAESAGKEKIVNSIGASGYWQIYGLPFPGDPLDGFTNAQMAGAKLRSQGLGAWEAYTNGSFRRFMGDGLGRAAMGGRGRRGGAGGSVFHFSPRVTVQGTDRATIRSELSAHLDRFVDQVMDEINSGSEELEGALG